MSSVQRAGLLPLNPDLKAGPGIEFESRLSSLVVGQEGAVRALASLYQVFHAGMADPSRPLGTLLFLGPTGSGKTHVVETAAEILFGSSNALIKIDCAEFQHSHEIAKLIGSPPGYLGHRETSPLLTQENIDKYRTRRDPFTLVLFDEIEKASESLWQLLLGILDKATLTLGDNRRVDFSQTMIFMTSNLGAKEMSELITGAIGFAPAQSSGLTNDDLERKINRTAVEAAKRRFSPEFMNRIDKIAVFRSLSHEELRKILDLELNKVRRRIEEGGGERFYFTLTESAKEFLLSEGTDLRYGARHLKRAIERHLVYPMANLSVSGQVRLNDAVIVDYDQESGRLDFFLDKTAYSNSAINFMRNNGLPWANFGKAGYGGMGNRRSIL
ncbi:MAG TPA: AAA family ATPase [Blastocatellia bacterium]|nr:AAA family ATPase [Blastocatellia bacterium]